MNPISVREALALDSRRWREFAACKVDPDSWFPEQGIQNPYTVAPMKSVCRECPVRAECLDWALGHPEATETGIWAGLTGPQLGRLRNAERRARKAGA